MPENNQNCAQWNFTYTAIPNYFLDFIADTLSASELKVMLYIYRHTLGYRKLADYISYDQFLNGIKSVSKTSGEETALRVVDNGAGISRRALVSALISLEKRGLIRRHQKGFAPSKIEVVIPQSELAVAVTQNIVAAKQKEKNTAKVTCEEAPQDVKAENSVESANNALVETTQVVQSLPQKLEAKMQNLHSTKENNQKQNIKPKETGRFTLTNLVDINQKANADEDFLAAVDLLKASATSLTLPQAKKLVSTAFSNGRDVEYLRQLVAYVTTNPEIKIPAAVLTNLISTNSVRANHSPSLAKVVKSHAFSRPFTPKLDLKKLAARLEKSTSALPEDSSSLTVAPDKIEPVPEFTSRLEFETALRFSLENFNKQAAKALRSMFLADSKTLVLRFWGSYSPELTEWLPEVQLYYPEVVTIAVKSMCAA